MKRKALLILVMMALLMCMLVISASATEITVGDITYTLTQGATPEKNTAVINSHKNVTFTTTDITIPVSVQDADGVVYYVTGLHSEAFRSTNLTNLLVSAYGYVRNGALRKQLMVGRICFTAYS